MDVIEYLTRHITLVLDNDQWSHEHVNALARNVIREDGLTAPEWLTMDAQHREELYAGQIGELTLGFVEDVIDARLQGDSESLGALLIREIIMGHGSSLAYALGVHYMPEDSDMEDVLPDGDEDED